ncbi:hypothetical protein QFZ60_002356 [Arthrobacter sp. B2I5]|nr:hypothetical protein [Arthrobacter sp. B2I5]
MQAYDYTHNHRHIWPFFLAVILGSVLLVGPETAIRAKVTISSATTSSSRAGARANPSDGWSQLPLEARELWKFRFTRGR